MPEGETKPGGSQDEGHGDPWIGLVVKREIGEDSAGEEHWEPKEPAVGLRL